VAELSQMLGSESTVTREKAVELITETEQWKAAALSRRG